MNKLSLVLGALFLVILNAAAENCKNIRLFENEKLGIFHTVKLDGELAGDLVPLGHYISFNNYTNNNIRVTYKVTVRVTLRRTGGYKDFTYNKTLYIKPQDTELEFLTDNGILDYMQNNSPDMYIEKYCTLQFRNFELINYGVEKKNYETAY